MKNLFMAILLLAGITASAQADQKMQRPRGEKMSKEQRSELRLKEMTLQLELNASQQQKIGQLLDEQAAKRDKAMAERRANQQNKKQLTADEKFELKSKMLDERIEMKAKLKDILTKEQFEKWESRQSAQRDKVVKVGKERKMRKTEKSNSEK